MYICKYVIDYKIWELIKEQSIRGIYFPTHQPFNNPENFDDQSAYSHTDVQYLHTGWRLSVSPDYFPPKCPVFAFSNNNNNKKRRRAVLIRGFVRLTWLTRRAEEDWGKGRGKGRMPLSFRVFIISANWGVAFRRRRLGLNLKIFTCDLYLYLLFFPAYFRWAAFFLFHYSIIQTWKCFSFVFVMVIFRTRIMQIASVMQY